MRNYGLVLVACLVIGCGGSKGKADLAVTATPTGKIEGPLRVILNFSKPMVAKDKIGQPVAKYPLSISPAIEGQAKWTDDKTLVLVPTKSLPVSTKFVASVPEGTRALDGGRLGKTVKFEFFTERLTGTIELLGSKQRAARDQVVKLSFNQEVPFDQIAKHCGFDGKGKHHGVKLAPEAKPGPARQFSIVPSGELAMDTDWVVACKADLRGSVGNLGLEAKLEEKFRTYGPLKFVSLEPSGNDIVPDEDLQLKIAFTNPLKPPYQMTISPTVPGFPKRCHGLGDSPPGLACGGLLEANTTYTLTIDATQKDMFGQSLDKKQVLTFRTTNAKPTISMESGYFIAELKRPVVPLWSRNVSEIELTAVAITPANFHEVQPMMEWWESKPADFSKTKLKPQKKTVKITGTKNQWGQHSLDPAQLFGGKPGPGMWYMEVASNEVKKRPYTDGGREKVLVNFTDIGVVSKLSGTRGLVWATQLSTGKPLPGAQVSVRDGNGRVTFTGTTDAEGIAMLPGTRTMAKGVGENDRETDLRVYVSHQADWTMVNPSRSGGLSPWTFNVALDRDSAPAKLRGFMHTDRGLYRPGEKVHVKGLARVTKLGEPLEVPTDKKVVVEVNGPQGKQFAKTEAKLSPFGGFWFDLDLPADARLGDYYIKATLPHGTFTREFSVEEYRPATFEVTGKAKEANIVRRADVHATISANYFYGAPVRSGQVDVVVHSRPRQVKFEKYAEFEFGDDRRYDSYSDYESDYSQTMLTEDHVALDDKGNANLAVAISPNDIGSDADLLVRANVTSPSNEVIGKSFTIPYFHSRVYYGIKAPGYFLDVKKPQKFQIVALSPDGKPVDTTAKVTVTRHDWNCVWEEFGYRGSYQCTENKPTIVKKTLTFAGGKPAELEFTPDSAGDYLIVVEGDNVKQEAAISAQRLYAWGGGGGSWRSSDTLSFDIAADKKEYKAGDTASLILKTDLAEATGLVTIERDGVIEKRLIKVTPTEKRITVPITANHAPNVYVSVALVQGRTGDGPRAKPRMRMGIVNLPVRPQDNTLKVTVEPDRKDYRPGDNVTATVKVTDAAGKPVSAEVSITAADEGVLSLIGYETPNPVPTFYAPWAIGVTTATQLEYLRDIPAPNVERPATGGDAPGTVRSRFVSTAVWTPGAVTNAEGVATVQFKAPDNLTAFRIMAVAADKGYRFGSADKRFTVSKPLQLHQAMPRFLSLGDAVQGGVIVHNETGKPGTATVKLVVDAKLMSKGPLERTVQVAKDARVPVLFDLAAAEVGATALRFTVSMNGENDGLEIKLPVKMPSPLQTHHVEFGATKDPKTIAVKVPADAIASSAEVVISVDPDGLSGIEEGLSELIEYPHGCLEQTTSKVIPMLAVRELAETLRLAGLSGKALDGFVTAGITKIGKHQTAYGGFSLWPGGEPEAYYTAYALWGLYLAKQAGYKIDQQRIDEGLAYLNGDGKSPDTSRKYYSEVGNLGAQAFALYVRAVFKDKSAGAAVTTLIANPKLPIYGRAFAARALAASVGKKDPAVIKLVAELGSLAAAAKPDTLIEEPSEKELDYYMSSGLRTSSAVLLALVELDPKHPTIAGLVRAIMKARRAAQYLDTQESLYSLLALTSYAKTAGGPVPSVTVELAGKPVITGALSGKQRIRLVTAPATSGDIKITPKGQVHYNVDVRYRRKPETLKAQSNGIALTQEYFDEAGKPKTAFTVGDVVAVRVTSALKKSEAHLVVSAALPAGFEALNTRFETVGSQGVKQTEQWGVYREMRDDRVDFVSEYSDYGDYVYEFTMRATSVGKFVRPPTTSELMYDPEVNANTALDVIEIKPK